MLIPFYLCTFTNCLPSNEDPHIAWHFQSWVQLHQVSYKSLFGKQCNDEGHSSKAVEQKFETCHTATSATRKKLKEQLKIVSGKKEGKQILIYNTTNFESEKLFGLVTDRNKRNTANRKHWFYGIILQQIYPTETQLKNRKRLSQKSQ